MTTRLNAALLAIGTVAIALPTWVALHPPSQVRARAKVRKLAPRRVVSPVELPPVEPVAFVDLSPDEARAYNDTVPFVTGPNPAARPFRFAGSAEDRARALDCLAAAVLYEAGDDAPGERAVAQVVLNRLRHPAFPKTVCGVVFEGQERATGCQFTFTCDGAIDRWKPSEAGWKRAREVAELALSGAVFRPVGYATHYHTDWVVPYWQSSLDKLARVESHLFFRWTGWWGTPPAFNRRQLSPEPTEAKIAAFSDAHKTGAAMEEVAAALAEAATVTGSAAAAEIEPDWFAATLPAGLPPDGWPAWAAKLCGERPRCTVTSWRDARATPASRAQTPDQIAAMTFSYRRDREIEVERSLWNCQQTPRPAKNQCMRQQVLLGPTPVPTPTPTPAAVPTRGPADLDGVRRAPGPATSPPGATPSPRP